MYTWLKDTAKLLPNCRKKAEAEIKTTASILLIFLTFHCPMISIVSEKLANPTQKRTFTEEKERKGPNYFFNSEGKYDGLILHKWHFSHGPY